MNTIITVLIFIAILSLLVFVHELGHFWTALKMKMKVEEFGFGFPPRAFGVKRNGVLYSVNWLPLGGFVKIKGEDGSQRDEPDSFASKKPWQRFVVLSAGVFMNFVLAGFLFGIGYMIGLPQALDGVGDAQVTQRKVQVVSVLPDSPAEKAGITLGDSIEKFNGVEIESVEQLISLADQHVGQTVTFEIKRGQEVLSKDIEVIRLEATGKGGIGVGLIATGVVSYPFHLAIYKGFESAVLMTGAIISSFYGMIKNIIIGQGVGMEVSGPVGIAVLTGQVAKLGLTYLIQFTAILSLNLAVINFLPFPALDGGRVLFVLIEKLRGKPVSQKLEGAFHAAGMLLLLLLIVVVTYKDIVRMFT